MRIEDLFCLTDKNGNSRMELFLNRLHNKLNKEIFHSKLKKIPIGLTSYIGSDDIGCDFCAVYRFNSKTPDSRIDINPFILLQEMPKFNTQKEQLIVITIWMLHEMIHQYCHEHNIDDGQNEHNDNYNRVANAHGLIRTLEDNGVWSESLDLLPYMAIYNCRIY